MIRTISRRKIRIGYVLKSADVRTLFSGRNSENSSNTHAHTSAYPCTPTHTHASPRTPSHTQAHLDTPAHTCAPAHTPHIPADAQLDNSHEITCTNWKQSYVNRPNTKKAQRNKETKKQRKKKEGTRVR